MTSNRRKFLGKGVAASAAVVAASSAHPANAQQKPEKKVLWKDGKKPEKTPLFSSTVLYGNLLFIAGVGAHFDGDITTAWKAVGTSPAGNPFYWKVANSTAPRDTQFASAGVRYLITNCGAGGDGRARPPGRGVSSGRQRLIVRIFE